MKNRHKIISILLALIMVMSVLTVFPCTVSADETNFKSAGTSSVSGFLATINDEPISVVPKGACKLNVIIFGRPSCYNTCTVLSNISSANLTPDDSYQIIYADIDGNDKNTVAELKNKYPNGIAYCYGDNESLMWNLTNYSSLSLPLIAYVDSSGKAIICTQGIQPLATIKEYISKIKSGNTISGTTGSCTWKLDCNGNLTISGNGKMGDYSCYDPAPWGCEFSSAVLAYGVTSIGDYAFEPCRDLVSISVPETVISIGENAFTGCSNLSDITFPKGLTEIANGAFQRCYNLTNISLPNNLTYIGEYAFSNCTGFDKIVLPKKITEICDMTFINCRSMKSIAIPKGVTQIGFAAFAGCDSLKDIYYAGTQAEWNNIAISSSHNEPLENATIHFNSDLWTNEKLGDADGNGLVEVIDATWIQRYVAGIAIPFNLVKEYADTDEDGIVTLMDASWLQRYLGHLNTTPKETKPTEPPIDLSDFNTAYEAEVLRLINIERSKNNLPPLSYDAGAADVAHLRAKELYTSYSHTRPDGRPFYTAANDLHVSYHGTAENIAMGYHSPGEVVIGWMNSEGHRANILDPDFTKIGIGCYDSGTTLYWSQFFMG